MMPAHEGPQSLADRLPPARGKIALDAPLARLTWFGVGGPAEALFRPADIEDLQHFLAELPADIPVTVLGPGSNVLIRDGGIDGVVIRLSGSFSHVDATGCDIRAGAGASDVKVALAARDAGIAGLEFMRGIPGSVGGALRMNAGADGREIADVLVSARAVDRDGKLHSLTCAEMGYAYRHSSAPADWIFVDAQLRGWSEATEAIAARMQGASDVRAANQPVRTRTGGSTFKNPPGQKAWQLIDAAGCRGLSRGDAVVSELHCNFLINLGAATAADLEGLGEEVRRRVLENTGTALEWEIQRLGRHARTSIRGST